MNLNKEMSRKDFLKYGTIGAIAFGIFMKQPLQVGAATVRDNLGGGSTGSASGSGGNNGSVIKKATAPNNTNALWIDTSVSGRAIPKYYKDGEGWVPLAAVWSD